MAHAPGARDQHGVLQFHPTTFYHVTAPNLLISEAVRGAGTRLVDGNGEPFMQRYAPEWKDLARVMWWRAASIRRCWRVM